MEYLRSSEEYIWETLEALRIDASIPEDVYEDAMYLTSLDEEELRLELEIRPQEAEEHLRDQANCHFDDYQDIKEEINFELNSMD